MKNVKIRTKMMDKVGNNYTCTGRFIRYEKIRNVNKMLLTNIVSFHGEQLAHHVWIDEVEGFEYGDIVNFCGKVKPYKKRVNGDVVTDYCFKKVKYVYKKKA